MAQTDTFGAQVRYVVTRRRQATDRTGVFENIRCLLTCVGQKDNVTIMLSVASGLLKIIICFKMAGHKWTSWSTGKICGRKAISRYR